MFNSKTGSKSQENLLNYRENITSQNGEDGILKEIFRRLDISRGWFVEFGAWDGKHLSNTFCLLASGWRGVEIEGDEQRFNDLIKTKDEYPKQIIPICAYVEIDGENCLDSLLSKTPIPEGFDLLSIDIDSYDWQVWNSLLHCYPKVVVIEINGSIPPGIEHIHNEKINSSSWTSTIKLAQGKGYSLVCFTGNMIFIKNEYLKALKLPSFQFDNPDSLFLDYWVKLDFGMSFLHIGIQAFILKLLFDLSKVYKRVKKN